MITLGFVGTTEIVVILIIALLVFGPQKLPEVGRQIGSLYQELNRMRGDVQRALDIDPYSYNNSYDGRDVDTNPYTNGYNYDTPAESVSHTSQIYGADGPSDAQTGLVAGGEGFVAPPGPSGTVASRSPFSQSAADAEHSLPSDTTAHIYTQPETGDAPPAPPHKEPNPS